MFRSIQLDGDSYASSPRSGISLANLRLADRGEAPQQHGSLDAFDPFDFPQHSRKELSLNPKGDSHTADSDLLDIAPPPVLRSSSDFPASSSSTASTLSPTPAHLSGSPVSPPGGYLEPSSHFFVNSSSPAAVLQSLLSVLQTSGVDCQLHPECFKMKCEAYRDCSRVEFCVRLFAIGDERGDFAVEFQRRFGDGIAFHSIYADTRKAFEQQTLQQQQSPQTAEQQAAQQSASVSAGSSDQAYTASSPPPLSAAPSSGSSSSPLRCPPLDIPEMRCCKQVQCDVLKYLLAMCKSDCVDVKANAITALAEMSSKREMKEAMLQSGAVDIFLQSLSCSYQDVHRCALTGLANLITCRRNTGTCQLWMQKEKMAHMLCKLINSGCPQIVREAARSMELIAETLKDQLKDDVCFRHCVEKLLCSQDLQARQSAQRAQETLRLVL